MIAIKSKFVVLYIVASILMLISTASFAVTLKIATVSPEGATWMVKMREGAKEIKKRTQDRVKFKFYSGGIMGSDDAKSFTMIEFF